MQSRGTADSEPTVACDGLALTVTGRVQAVGFRPFVYRLARQCGLSGWVRNRTGVVEICVAGTPDNLTRFERDLVHAAPPLAHPVISARQTTPAIDVESTDGKFEIRDSATGDEPRIFVPPDYFMCEECARELSSPNDRRYRYPFINCTQCGPRYTLIQGMPYDRAQTTMASFDLCDACREEYTDPMDRRFHAEPLACPDCGPTAEFNVDDTSPVQSGDAAIAAATAALHDGRIVAIKGIGGYHLMCDAGNATAVANLRQRKARPDKPLAVMFPHSGADGLDAIRHCATLSDEAAKLISGPGRPIVLVPLRPDSPLAANIAPGLGELGVFLPYSPLHQLLLDDVGGPLVATSGNLSGEPVLTDNAEADARLSGIADAFLHHDRPIERPADDPVYRRVAGRMRPLRLGRGCAPLELVLNHALPEPVLAVGGHLKNTIALAWDDRVVISPHIGEMDTPRSLHIFEQVVNDLQHLYGVRAKRVICDAHAGYATHRWAREQPLPVHPVHHHHAHASALAGEHPETENWLVFAWDGVGMGEDGTLWGGETFHGAPGAWQRTAALRSFRLPGGDLAGRQPWRSAAAICWESDRAWPEATPGDEIALVRQAWQRDLNCHTSSAAGRLFDAAACLVLGVEETSFEGQGPMQLEAVADDTGPIMALPLHRDDAGILRADWQPLLPMLCDSSKSVGERAAGLHLSLADAIANIALTLAEERRVERIGLTGGVFQNDRLATAAKRALEARGFKVHLPEQIPCNDAGLSYGQVIEYLARTCIDRGSQE
jgi:hydrogenase maturation protein HypF